MTAPIEKPEDVLKKLVLPRPAGPDAQPVNLSELLIATQLMATDEDRTVGTKKDQKWDAETPASLQAIKSGITKATAAWLKRAGAAGGTAGLLATIGGVVIAAVEPFGVKLGGSLAVALFGAAALIISVTVVALSHFVVGDLAARGQATAARHAARADVIVAFLKAVEEPAAKKAAEDPPLRAELIAAIGAFDEVYVTTTDNPAWVQVTGYRVVADGEGFQVRLTGGDWKPLREIKNYTTDPA